MLYQPRVLVDDNQDLEPKIEEPLKRTTIDFTKGAKKLAHAISSQAAKEAGVRPMNKKQKREIERKAATAYAEAMARKTGASAAKLKEEQAEAEEAAKHVAPKKKEKVSKPICNKLKKDGQPCTAHSMLDKTYCTDHRPAIDHLKPEEITILKARWSGDEGMARFVEDLGWGRARLIARQPN